MFWALLFAICALGLAWLLAHGIVMPAGLAVIVFIFCFALGFALMHILYLFVFWLLSGRPDRTKPIEKKNPISWKCCTWVGDFLSVYGGVRLHVSGEEKLPEGRFLFVCNHRSVFDPLVVLGRLPGWEISFVSKPSNLAIPMVGDIAYASGFLPIDRENDRNALKTILMAADYMKRGVCSMGIYPEGTRSKDPDGQLLPFHAGSFKAAQRAGVPLVICCIRGTEKIRKRLFLPNDVYLDVLDVLPAAEVKAMSTVALAEYSRELMEKRLGLNEK